MADLLSPVFVSAVHQILSDVQRGDPAAGGRGDGWINIATLVDRAWLLTENIVRNNALAPETKPLKPAAKCRALPFVDSRRADGGGDARLRGGHAPLPPLPREPAVRPAHIVAPPVHRPPAPVAQAVPPAAPVAPRSAILPPPPANGPAVINSAFFARIGEPSVSAASVHRGFLTERRGAVDDMKAYGASLNELEWYRIKGGEEMGRRGVGVILAPVYTQVRLRVPGHVLVHTTMLRYVCFSARLQCAWSAAHLSQAADPPSPPSRRPLRRLRTGMLRAATATTSGAA